MNRRETHRRGSFGCGGTPRPSARRCWRARGWARTRRSRGTRRSSRRRFRRGACGQRKVSKKCHDGAWGKIRWTRRKNNGRAALAGPRRARGSRAEDAAGFPRYAPEDLALVGSERLDVVGRLVDGDEEVARILPLVPVVGGCVRPGGARGALLGPALLAEPLNGAEDRSLASLGASAASDGEPGVAVLVRQRGGTVGGESLGGFAAAGCRPARQRLGVDEVDERANAGAVVQPELVLQGAVANVIGHVQAEAALGRLVDAEHVAVRRTLGGIRPAPSGGSVEGELDLIVGALLLTELVGAVGGKSRWSWMERQDVCAGGSSRPIRHGRDARGRSGDRDSGEYGETSHREISPRLTFGGTHRTSCVSLSGSVLSTKPLGCAVIIGHGTSLDMSSSTTTVAAARAPRPEAGPAGFGFGCPAICCEAGRDSGRRRSARACEATVVPSYRSGVIHVTWTLMRLRARV